MTKIGRNDPCPCGSGKKYKKCCLDKDREESLTRATARAKPMEDDFEDLPLFEEEDSTADKAEKRREKVHKREFRRYPKPREKLPKLSPDEKKIVEAWWDNAKPFYDKNDSDEMMQRVISFMEKYPDLFVHLELHYEFLFELGAALSRRKRWSEYIDLLMRIRLEHPEMYELSFGYYDFDIIAHFIITGHRSKIPGLFNFFEKYPDSDPRNASRIIDLLVWTGMETELFEFVKAIAIPMWTSKNVTRPGFALHWHVFQKHLRYLDSQIVPEVAAKRLKKDIQEINIPDRIEIETDLLSREFELCRKKPENWDISSCRTMDDVYFFYHDVAWNFCAFLHNSMGFGWAKSRFLAEQTENYWLATPDGKRPKESFRIIEKHMDKYIATNCRDIIYIDGICAVSFLQSLWYFADYLLASAIISAEECSRIHSMCTLLYERAIKTLDVTDPARWLISSFPEMITQSS